MLPSLVTLFTQERFLTGKLALKEGERNEAWRILQERLQRDHSPGSRWQETSDPLGLVNADDEDEARVQRPALDRNWEALAGEGQGSTEHRIAAKASSQLPEQRQTSAGEDFALHGHV